MYKSKPANKRKRHEDQEKTRKAEMAGFFHSDDKTLRKHIKKYVNAIAALKEEKVVWDDGDDEIFLLSVDSVHFRINEPRTEPS
jgi:hypothetical protein